MVGVGADGLVDTRLGVGRDSRLEEVGLALQRDHLHEVEGVGHVPDLGVAKGDEQSVGDKLDVLAHELGVHTDKRNGESVCQELLLDLDRLLDNLGDGVRVRSSSEVGEEETGKVGVKTLVSRDELVGEGESGHETSLLEPEDRGEGSREEDSLDGRKGDQSLGESRLSVRDPFDGPLSLLLDTGDGVDGLEEVGSSGGVLDVGVDEERVGLRVDVLPDSQSGTGSGRGLLLTS